MNVGQGNAIFLALDYGVFLAEGLGKIFQFNHGFVHVVSSLHLVILSMTSALARPSFFISVRKGFSLFSM